MSLKVALLVALEYIKPLLWKRAKAYLERYLNYDTGKPDNSSDSDCRRATAATDEPTPDRPPSGQEDDLHDHRVDRSLHGTDSNTSVRGDSNAVSEHVFKLGERRLTGPLPTSKHSSGLLVENGRTYAIPQQVRERPRHINCRCVITNPGLVGLTGVCHVCRTALTYLSSHTIVEDGKEKRTCHECYLDILEHGPVVTRPTSPPIRFVATIDPEFIRGLFPEHARADHRAEPKATSPLVEPTETPTSPPPSSDTHTTRSHIRCIPLVASLSLLVALITPHSLHSFITTLDPAYTLSFQPLSLPSKVIILSCFLLVVMVYLGRLLTKLYRNMNPEVVEPRQPCGSHTSHLLHPLMKKEPPFVPFLVEPPTSSEQVAKLGGRCVRLNFGERCYNPGLVRNYYSEKAARSDFLMTYRSAEVNREQIAVSTLHLCGVMADGSIKWSVPLDLPEIPGEGCPMQEDARLIWHEGWLLVAYSNVRLRQDGVTFKQSITRLNLLCGAKHKGFEHVDKKSRPFAFEAYSPIDLPFGRNGNEHPEAEKNWQFFSRLERTGEERLKCVYTICPHVVFDVAKGTHYVTICPEATDWESTWGEMHGGTPPIDLGGGQWLSFFNSFVKHPEHQRRYVIGAYIFSDRSTDGHRITHITDGPLLVGSERDGFLWESPVFWEPIVNFAVGAILHKGSIVLSYGVNDCFSYLATIPLESITRKMRPVR